MIKILSQLCLRCDGWFSYVPEEKTTCTCDLPKLYEFNVGTAKVVEPQPLKPMSEQDMINFFNYEMGGPFNQNVEVKSGGHRC